MTAPSPIVRLDRLTVLYGRAPALRDVTVAFGPGATGLLGPNGAGKSSLLKTLLGFVVPEAGELRVFDLDVRLAAREVRRRIGYMPENDAHIPGMTAVEFVAYCGQLAGLPEVDAIQRAHEVLQYVGLGEARYRRVETYSTGMKQRIKLAQALVHDPDLLFLDEPTNGMDPKGRDEMLALVHDLGHAKHMNLILSSHVLPDVEATCDNVVVLDNGTVAAGGSIHAMKGASDSVYELRIKGDRDAFARLLRGNGLECLESEEDVMRVFVPAGQSARVVFEHASRAGVQVRHFRPSVPTLEDAFARALGDR